MPYVVSLFVIKVFKKEQGQQKFFLIFCHAWTWGDTINRWKSFFTKVLVCHTLDMTSWFFLVINCTQNIHSCSKNVSVHQQKKRLSSNYVFFCPHMDILNNNKRIQVQSNNNKCLFIDLFFFSWQYPKKGHIFWDAKNRKSNMEIGFLDYPFMAAPNPFFKTIFMIKIIHE